MSTHLNPLDILLESQKPDRPPPDFRWGLVHGTSPDLSVRLDRDPTTVIGSCCSLSYPLEAGDRVMVMIYDGRAVVFGRGGGDRPSDQWQPWSPTLTGVATNPTMGNSTRTGRYILRSDGTVSFVGQIVIGNTFSPGSGFYSMLVPVPANSSVDWPVDVHLTSFSTALGHGDALGDGKIEGGIRVGRLYIRQNNTTTRNDTERLGSTSGLAAGDKIIVSGTYEAA